MAWFINVLVQPVNWGLTIWLKVQKYSFFLYQGFALRGTVNFLVLGQLIGWAVVGAGYLAAIGLAIKFVAEGAEIEGGNQQGAFYNVVWRVLVMAALYVIIAVLLTGFFSFVWMLNKEMRFTP